MKIMKRCLTVLLSVLLALSLCGCDMLLPAQEEGLAPPLISPKSIEYITQAVGRDTVVREIQQSGVLVSASEHVYSFETAGRVDEIYVSAGSYVEKGELLITLQADTLYINLRQKRIDVEKIELDLANLKSQLEYYEALPRSERPNDITMNNLKTNIRSRELDLESQSITLDTLERQYSGTQMFAEEDGLVTFVERLTTGDSVAASQAVVTIADPDDLVLQLEGQQANETYLGMAVDIVTPLGTVGGEVVQCPTSVPSSIAQKYATSALIRITQVPSGVDVSKELWNALGQRLDLKITVAVRENVIAVPNSAIKRAAGRVYVEILDSGRKMEVDVVVGIAGSAMSEILSGLYDGQMLIVG